MLWMVEHEHCSQAVLLVLSVVRIILRQITIRATYITTLISLPVAAIITVITAVDNWHTDATWLCDVCMLQSTLRATMLQIQRS